MRKLCIAIALIGSGATATAASAQEMPSGFYLGAAAGIGNLDDVDVTYYDIGGTFGGTGAQDTADATIEFDRAATFSGTIGYDFGPVRTDLEVSYGRNKAEGVTFNRVNGAAVTLSAADRVDVCDYLEADTCGGSGNTFTIDGSRARQLNAMVNLWGELPLGAVTPYVGGGLGVAGFEVDGEGKAKFAWQLGAGVGVNLSSNFVISADYRRRQISDTTIEWDANSGLRVGDFKTDTFTVGFRVYL